MNKHKMTLNIVSNKSRDGEILMGSELLFSGTATKYSDP